MSRDTDFVSLRKFMNKRVLVVVFLTAAVAVTVWSVLRYSTVRRNHRLDARGNTNSPNPLSADAWAEAVEKVKAPRVETVGNEGIVIPPELQHYSDRHWFLAAQVAEVEKYKVHTCQDYVDLAAMIKRGEMVGVPGVTDTYVLYGVGAKADESVFTRYEDERDIEIYSEAQLGEAYRRLDDRRLSLQSEIASLKVQSGKLNKRERTKQSELQKQIAAREEDLKSADEDKALLVQVYGESGSRQKLFRDYESLRTLANSFNGRSFNIENPADRQALKGQLLSSLRPVALKILEEVASAYHQQFDRPLPVSSLVRPEQYQHALSKVNRNAVLIDTPPHSTGLAFDIDYRYMSAAEQTFLMAELAGLKREGRIEVIRERKANYHVFAFLNGARPSDDLIAASLEKVTEPMPEAHHPPGTVAKVKSQPRKTKTRATKPHKRKRSR